MRKEFLLVLLFFIGITIFFFSPLLKGLVPFPGDYLVGNYKPYNTYTTLGFAPGGYPNKAQGFDVLKLLYPAKEFSIRLLQSGQIPLWNPYNFSGNPHVASLQSGTFYPINIIFFLFSFPLAWGFYIGMQPFLAGIFTYFFLKELKLSWKASVFGAICFAFSSYMTVWIEYGNLGHAILWLPFVLWMTIKYVKAPKIYSSIALIFGFTFSILAGYIQATLYIFIYTFLFSLFYFWFIDKKQILKKLAFLVVVFIVPFLLSALQLLPAFELFINSTRSSYTYEALIKLLIPQFHIITAFVPDFFGNPATRNYWISGTYIERVSYVGVIPLIFILYALLKKRSAYVWFFTATLISIYLMVYDSFITKILYSIYLPPIISTGVPSRMMFLFCFAASTLAAFGVHAFEQDKEKKLFLRSLLGIGGVYFLLWIFVFIAPKVMHTEWVSNISIAKRNLLLPSGIFIVSLLTFFLSFRIALLKRYYFFLLLFLTIFDLFYFFNKITPFAPVGTIYPKTDVLEELKNIQGIDRSWGYGSGYIEANMQTHEQIFSTDGYDALHINSYGQFVTTSKEGKIAQKPPRSEADIIGGYGTDDLRNNRYRQRVLNILGVKYILDTSFDPRTFPEDRYLLVWQKGPWQIYENRQSLPRVFLAGNFIVEKDREKIIDKLYSDIDLRNTIILEEKPDLLLASDSAATVAVKSYTPNRAVFQTSTKENMLLFLSDNYFPGWGVSIDGISDKIYRANYSFRAVVVPKGEHRVIFTYYPKSFSVGLKISILTLVLLLLFVLIIKKR